MAAKTDPGSYAVHDEPFDTYGATKVPLRTPHGPITLTFTQGNICIVESGYAVNEYSSGIPNLTVDAEAFTWKGTDVLGSMNLYLTSGWSTEPLPGHVPSVYLYGRGRGITDKMEKEIAGYWAEVVRRYASEHPHIPAHAAFRASVRSLQDQEDDIRKAEEALTALRRTRAKIRREVRRAFTADYTLGEPGAMDAPRTYHDDSTYTSGYVVELKNVASLMRSLDALRDAANGQEK